MLSFQIINAGRGIQIYCDAQGVDVLNNAIRTIQPGGGHVHLLTPSNGGKELAEQTPWGGEVVGEVIITWAGD